ncbi:MAG: YHS domain-containing protein [Planctomycetes bacterium]|nr:YHS domain-containing protein [Planctomycetota bacterium]MBI5796256.1 YHS domain-containing protein [Planctomycetota bacterium]
MDHVCGMEVHKDKALKLEHDGKTYYFCSKNCEETFKKEPSKYLKKETKHKEEKEKEAKGKTHND